MREIRCIVIDRLLSDDGKKRGSNAIESSPSIVPFTIQTQLLFSSLPRERYHRCLLLHLISVCISIVRVVSYPPLLPSPSSVSPAVHSIVRGPASVVSILVNNKRSEYQKSRGDNSIIIVIGIIVGNISVVTYCVLIVIIRLPRHSSSLPYSPGIILLLC